MIFYSFWLTENLRPKILSTKMYFLEESTHGGKHWGTQEIAYSFSLNNGPPSIPLKNQQKMQGICTTNHETQVQKGRALRARAPIGYVLHYF